MLDYDTEDPAACYAAIRAAQPGAYPDLLARAYFRKAVRALTSNGQTTEREVRDVLGISYVDFLALMDDGRAPARLHFQPTEQWREAYLPILDGAWSAWCASQSAANRAQLGEVLRECVNNGATVAWLSRRLRRSRQQIYRWLQPPAERPAPVEDRVMVSLSLATATVDAVNALAASRGVTRVDVYRALLVNALAQAQGDG